MIALLSCIILNLISMRKQSAFYLTALLCMSFLSSCQSNSTKVATNSKEDIIAEADKYKTEEQHDKACELYAKAYQLDKNDAYLNLRLGFCKLTANQKDSALVYYNASINIKPSEDAYIQRASCYLLMGKYTEVQTDAKAALVLNPKSVKAVTLMGAANFKAGNYNEALRNFKQGLVLNAEPTLPANEKTNPADLYRNIAKTYYDTKQLDSAVQYCTLWIESDTADFEAYRFRSIINEGRGKLDAAIVDIEHIITLQPQYIQAYAKGAELYMSIKKEEKACELATKAKTNNAKGYEALVNAYCKPK